MRPRPDLSRSNIEGRILLKLIRTSISELHRNITSTKELVRDSRRLLADLGREQEYVGWLLDVRRKPAHIRSTGEAVTAPSHPAVGSCYSRP